MRDPPATRDSTPAAAQAAIRAEFARCYDHIYELSRELASMKASRSWRMTRPLRWIGRRIAAARSLARRILRPVAHLIPAPVRQRIRHARVARVLRRSGLFDEAWYLARNPDVAAGGFDPVAHYVAVGAADGRDPGPGFDTRWYVSQNPDAAPSIQNPLIHYCRQGRDRGRLPLPPWSSDPRGHSPHLNLPGGGDVVAHAPRDRIAVHLHVYYLDTLDAVLAALRNVPRPFDLFITSNSEDSLATVCERVAATHPDIKPRTFVCPNVGRDLAPMLVTVGPTLLEYGLALHLHVKRSPEKSDPGFGRKWMLHNLDCLLHDARYVSTLVDLFELEGSCGVLHPKPFPQISSFLNWGANRLNTMSLFARLGIDPSVLDDKPLVFPAGSMFWFRPAALRRLLDGVFAFDDFPSEPIPDDGTIAHALERSLLYVVEHEGYSHYTISPHRAGSVRDPDGAPQASIVIPVHNAASTLHIALQSVLEQEVGNLSWEVVIVDDGSTDDSLGVARFYRDRFDEFRVVEQANRGAGAARNHGIAEARGEWIVFLDADDALTPGALRTLYEAAVTHDADVVVSRLRMFDELLVSDPMPIGYGAYGRPIDVRNLAATEGQSLGELVAEKELRSLFADFGPCAKIYRKEFLREHDLAFPEGVNYEDNAFTYEVYLHAGRLVARPETTYLYRRFHSCRGATRSTRVDLSAVRDQIGELDRAASRTVGIRNEALGRIVRESLLTKLMEMVEGAPGALVYLKALSTEVDALLARLDTRAEFEATRRLQQWLLP